VLACYLRDGERAFETYWTTGRGVEPMAPSHGLLDMTVYGRQEGWEDSPDGWPRVPAHFSLDGSPIAQWPRPAAGRSDGLGAGLSRWVVAGWSAGAARGRQVLTC
jgi:hypothetical protein